MRGRVLLLSDLSSFHTIRWSEALSDIGFDVLCAGLEWNNDDFPCNAVKVSSNFNKGFMKYFMSVKKFHSIKNKFRPSIIVSHMVGSYGYIGNIIKDTSVHITVAWGPDILKTPFKTPFHRVWVQNVVKKANAIVVDAGVLTDILTEYLHCPIQKIYVFPYGPDKKFKVHSKPVRVLKPPYNLVTHRKLEAEYDPDTIVNALAILKNRGIDFRFTFGSFGSLKNHIKTIMQRKGLVGYVIFTDRLSTDGLIDILDKNGIYVSASVSDSTSVSLLEAMSRGLFPVVSDIPANREWITHGKNGLLFKVGSAFELSENLMRIFNDPELYNNAIKHNFEVINKMPDFKDNVTRMIAHFTK